MGAVLCFPTLTLLGAPTLTHQRVSNRVRGERPNPATAIFSPFFLLAGQHKSSAKLLPVAGGAFRIFCVWKGCGLWAALSQASQKQCSFWLLHACTIVGKFTMLGWNQCFNTVSNVRKLPHAFHDFPLQYKFIKFNIPKTGQHSVSSKLLPVAGGAFRIFYVWNGRGFWAALTQQQMPN